ncbi:MAG: NAD-dependent dehydratase, partial [candidate division Zixibacteria bacterium SM23_73]
QTRSFCYVSDLIEALRMMMEKGDFIGPVNLGNPEEISILELAEKIVKLAQSKSRIAHKPLPPDDPHQRCPDISLAKQKLGWAPKKNLEEGLSATIEYFQKALSLA